ncbi:Glutathione synthase/RimK-type ligase, ATP-grasp superfamily [Geodermatophilus obscurus]|uniref:Glutathione synthase/RimK-type ligase, ATP-grasp superfamily n=1 Tax=Geodermatophilus obscurus TaxID=1861 RepID=A0A1I5GH96_9ACTN|nr:Glutathione synthase/RimK-type ligase, ATP-grasp superfamily [Geodermatophilus obscurus]
MAAVGSSRVRIGVATCRAAPDLDEDGPLLLAALDGAGADAVPAVWDDPDVDWAGFDGVLVRSTWDYPLRRAAFLEWVGRCRATVNPPPVLAWNTDKRYLHDLARAGVPTVPTVFLEPGEWSPAGAGPGDVVVKPAVSGSATDTGRFTHLSAPDATALVAALHAQGRTVMVQPYLPGIDTEGETSMVFLGGRFSHAVRREPLLAGQGLREAVVVADVLGTVRPAEPDEAQLAVARAALDAAPGGRAALSYARVDVIPGPAGPVLLELEVTDCFLFLGSATPEARARLARHALAALAGDLSR